MSRTWVFALTLLPLSLHAQGERISLRTAPAPNQTIRLGMTQEMAFDVMAEALPTGSMKMEGRTTIEVRQRVGVPDAQGRLTAEFTYDQVSMELMMNGSPMPIGEAMDQLKGKTMTAVYDAQGKVTDVKVPDEMGASGAVAKQMLTSLMGNIPNVTLGIGDTVTVPFIIPIPMAVPGAGPGEPLNLDTQIRYKLLSVVHEGPDRIAMLEYSTTGSMAGNMDFRMTGTGTTQLNVDKGFIKAGTGDSKMEMTMAVPGGGGTMHMTGTIRIVVTGSSEPR